MSTHILKELSQRYPQLIIPLAYEAKDSAAYKNAVLRGQPVEGELNFSHSAEDCLTVYDTPAGCAEVLYLEKRDDFEHAVQALAYRCEPREIPASMGATTIRGLINWQKIHNHRDEYIASGHLDWNAEFRRFTSKKSNYLDSIILISNGYYSAVQPETIGLQSDLWREKSVVIRTWHELTHFVCRGLFPDDIDAVRDEVFADMIGLAAAFGNYDPYLAKVFLGIENDTYRQGGRLENYLSETQTPEEPSGSTRELITFLSAQEQRPDEDIFAFLLRIFQKIKKKL